MYWRLSLTALLIPSTGWVDWRQHWLENQEPWVLEGFALGSVVPFLQRRGCLGQYWNGLSCSKSLYTNVLNHPPRLSFLLIPWGKTNSKSWSLTDSEIGPHFNSQVLSMRATFNMVLKYLMQKSARVIDWNIYLNINELRFAKIRSPCCHGHKCLTLGFAFLF